MRRSCQVERQVRRRPRLSLIMIPCVVLEEGREVTLLHGT